MLGSTTTLGTDTYGVVVVGKTVEAFDVVTTGTLGTGESSGKLGVVVETIYISKGKGGGHLANGKISTECDGYFFLGDEHIASVVFP
jgi:hypothetical protein